MKLISHTPVSNEDQFAEVWTYQRGTSLRVHAKGFLHLARLGAQEGLVSGPGIDAVTPAVLYAIRHAVELFLKSVVCDVRGLSRIKEPPPRGHLLLKIWKESAGEIAAWLEEKHGDLDFESWSSSFEDVLEELAGIDPRGQTLRYPSDVNGVPNLGGREVVSIGQVQRFIEHVHDLITEWDQCSALAGY